MPPGKNWSYYSIPSSLSRVQQCDPRRSRGFDSVEVQETAAGGGWGAPTIFWLPFFRVILPPSNRLLFLFFSMDVFMCVYIHSPFFSDLMGPLLLLPKWWPNRRISPPILSLFFLFPSKVIRIAYAVRLSELVCHTQKKFEIRSLFFSLPKREKKFFPQQNDDCTHMWGNIEKIEKMKEKTCYWCFCWSFWSFDPVLDYLRLFLLLSFLLVIIFLRLFFSG